MDRRDAGSTGRGVKINTRSPAQRSVASAAPQFTGTAAPVRAQRIGEHNQVGGRNVDDLAVATKSCTGGQDSFADPVRVDPISVASTVPATVSDHRRKFQRVVQTGAGRDGQRSSPLLRGRAARWRRVRAEPVDHAMFGDDTARIMSPCQA